MVDSADPVSKLRDLRDSIDNTQTAIWLAATCVRAADACFALGGSSALYETSPLQRWPRDLHVAAQHGIAQQRHYASAGKLLLGSSVVSSPSEEGSILGDGEHRARQYERPTIMIAEKASAYP